MQLGAWASRARPIPPSEARPGRRPWVQRHHIILRLKREEQIQVGRFAVAGCQSMSVMWTCVASVCLSHLHLALGLLVGHWKKCGCECRHACMYSIRCQALRLHHMKRPAKRAQCEWLGAGPQPEAPRGCTTLSYICLYTPLLRPPSWQLHRVRRLCTGHGLANLALKTCSDGILK